MYKKIKDIIHESDTPLSTTEVAEKAEVSIIGARKNLERLQEEGRIESVEKDGKICWKPKEEEEEKEKEKIEKRVQRA
ncbi:MAG: FaeA/PapI family transcriptional regulator [Candidatus Methanofastidiosia archaeon]|jgi:DNA-binding transcriptional regulator YhcF (GntR family)